MPESWSTRRARWLFNWFPAYRRTGGRIEYIAGDWSEVRVRVPLTWATRNYLGTTFGGSLYGALDPVYMLMLINLLGPDFIVWDKAAIIRFRRPGRATLWATFRVDPSTLLTIRQTAIAEGKLDQDFLVTLQDRHGTVHVECTKTLYVRWRAADSRQQELTSA